MFEEGALFYLCSSFANQVHSIDKGLKWNERLRKNYAINFLGYESNKPTASEEPGPTDVDAVKSKEGQSKDNNFVSHYKFMDTMGSGREFEHIQLIQIELPRAARILGTDEYVEKLNDPDLAVKPDEKPEQEEKERMWTTILSRSDELNEAAYVVYIC